MKPKPLTRPVVRLAATLLMLAEGHTTTPNVMVYLRERGFRAGQSEVSSWLFRIATRERWTINDSEAFRMYCFPDFRGLPMTGQGVM